MLIIIIIIIRNLYSAIMPLGGYRGAEVTMQFGHAQSIIPTYNVVVFD